MSRRTSRRRQQAKNEWRRTGRLFRLLDLGIPVQFSSGAWLFPPDPVRERDEYVRQITERVPLKPGEPAPMRGYIGEFHGIRILTTEAEVQAVLDADVAKGCGVITIDAKP